MVNVRISLKTKISLLIILTIIFVTISLEFLYIIDQRSRIKEFEKRFLYDTIKSAEALTFAIAPSLVENNYAYMNNMVSFHKRHSYRVYVLIIDDNNKIIAQNSEMEMGSEFKIQSVHKTERIGEGLIRRYYEAGKEFIDVSYPVKAGDLVLGTVRIGLTTDWLKEESDRIRRTILIFTLTAAGAIIVGALLAFLTSSKITKPILLLKQFAEDVGKGKYDQKVNVKSEDEVGILAASFNQMIEDLRNSRAQLVDKKYVDSIIANMSDILIVVSPEGLIKTINKTAADLLGYRESELLNQSIGVIFTEALQYKGSMLDELINKRFINNIETAFITKDGKKIPVLFSGSVMHDDSKILGIVCVAKDITDLKESEALLREQTQLALFTADVGIALTRSGTLRDSLQSCAKAMVQHLDAAFARIWTLNKEDNVLELQVSAGMYTHIDGPHGRVPVGKFKIGLIAEERKPHLTNDVIGDPRVGNQEWAKREGMIAFAGYPLIIEDHLVGVAAMFSKKPLSEFTLEALKVVSDNIAIGVERKNIEQKVIRLNRVYSMLSKINEAIVRARSMEQLFENSCRISVEYGRLRMVWIGLVDNETGLVRPVSKYGTEEGYLDIARVSINKEIPEGRGHTGSAIREGKPFICNDIEHEPYMEPWCNDALSRGYRSSAAFPLRSDDKIIGAITLYTTEPHFFDIEEIKLLTEVADDISFAIEFIEKDEKRRQAEEDVKERIKELEGFYEMAVGRELKMKELKERIASLEAEIEKLRR